MRKIAKEMANCKMGIVILTVDERRMLTILQPQMVIAVAIRTHLERCIYLQQNYTAK